MSYFNEDQQSWIRYLATVPPEKRCYCGWYHLGECSNCPPNKTCADKMREATTPAATEEK